MNWKLIPTSNLALSTCPLNALESHLKLISWFRAYCLMKTFILGPPSRPGDVVGEVSAVGCHLGEVDSLPNHFPLRSLSGRKKIAFVEMRGVHVKILLPLFFLQLSFHMHSCKLLFNNKIIKWIISINVKVFVCVMIA